MGVNCECVESDFYKKRLKVIADHYLDLKSGRISGPLVEEEIAYVFAQLCRYNQKDLKEAGIEDPKVLARAIG